MKNMTHIWLAATLLAGSVAVASPAQDQPLGDYARKVRKDKTQEQPAAKKFDNDNLPTEEKLSIVGTPTPAPDPNAAPADKAADKKDDKATLSAADHQKVNDDWKAKIDAQKGQIDSISRELDVMQREYRLKAAAFYGDAGERLRNSASWDKEDAQYKQQIADKQKNLDDAKQQLDNMQEDARKAGVPSSMRE